jgi:hypothetical protein
LASGDASGIILKLRCLLVDIGLLVHAGPR